jgi:hypothetical protein
MADRRRNNPSPERAIALWALVPGVPAAVLAFGIGSLVHLNVGASAGIGAAVAVGGFCAQVLALGWARGVGPGANQAVALFGLFLLLGLVAAVFFTLKSTTDWFATKAFAGGLLALVPVSIFEAHQMRHGRVAEIALDADRARAAASPQERT